MAGLLSTGQINSFLDSIKTVTDTFFVTPIVIYHTTDSIDRFNEDRTDMIPVEYHLKCLFEFRGENQIQVNQPGYTEFYDVRCTVNYRDAKAVAMTKDYETVLSPSKDYFEVNSKRYKIQGVSLDGPIQQENVLIVITGTLEEKMTT